MKLVLSGSDEYCQCCVASAENLLTTRVRDDTTRDSKQIKPEEQTEYQHIYKGTRTLWISYTRYSRPFHVDQLKQISDDYTLSIHCGVSSLALRSRILNGTGAGRGTSDIEMS